MESEQQSKLLTVPRIVTLLGSVLVALSSGTNYIYSAYAPQLGARLNVSHTQLNVIGLAGNVGVYSSGPIWGRIVDHRGPRIPLIGASVCLLVGYLGIKTMYDDGIGEGKTVSALHLALLVACGFMTGLGGNAGLGAAVNTTAKSFPDTARATTTGLVLSGFGLSAFWFSLLANILSPGNTSAFLLILALGTTIPMLIGLFIVKPIPLSPKSGPQNERPTDGYEPISSGEAVVFIDDAQDASDSDVEATAGDSSPLLSHSLEQSSYQVPVPSSSVEMNPPVSLSRGRDGRDASPNVYGKKLWLDSDFHIIFTIMGICSGTGIMYINNVGSIAQALYAKEYPVYNELDAAKWQAAQVSILSIGNFAGRLLIGLISDVTHTRHRLPRAYCLCIVSSLFVISQAAALIVSTVEQLWIATLLLGLAYGSLFGICPTIVIDWFGLAHFSENWGYASFSPLVGGNLLSLMFGRNLDAHEPSQGNDSSIALRVLSAVTRELPAEHLCFDGKDCYAASLQVTIFACIVSLGLSIWAGIRDGRKFRNRVHCVE